MSSKPVKKKPAPKAASKAPRESPNRPTGKVPEAMVASRHGTGMIERHGKGFSLGELSGAGLPSRLASRWGLGVDMRRRSVLQGNVESLKRWGSRPGAGKSAEGRVKKVEEELEKVEMEVKKEAAELKGEVVKVEKEVKKEAAKAEKAVKAKAKPKAKAKKKAET